MIFEKISEFYQISLLVSLTDFCQQFMACMYMYGNFQLQHRFWNQSMFHDTMFKVQPGS